MCCCRAICCRALQIGLHERLLLKPLDLKIELKYAESVEYLLGSFLKAVCSRCCWCGRTDVEGWCHVTNWDIIYRVKKTSEQDPESLGSTHLDGRTPQPQQGTQGKGTVFSESCFGIALMCGVWEASSTWWTWVWVNSGSWWWTGRTGVLRFMGSQRVGHDGATKLNWGKKKAGWGVATRHAVKHGMGYFQSKSDWSSVRSGGPLSGAPVASLVLSCMAFWSTSLSKFAAKCIPRLGSKLAC